MKQGTDQSELALANLRFGLDRCVLNRTGSSEQVEQECFDLVIRVMAKEDNRGGKLLCHFLEKSKSCFAGRILERTFSGQLRQLLRKAVEMTLPSEPLDETSILGAFSTAEIVIQVANYQPLEAEQ